MIRYLSSASRQSRCYLIKNWRRLKRVNSDAKQAISSAKKDPKRIKQSTLTLGISKKDYKFTLNTGQGHIIVGGHSNKLLVFDAVTHILKQKLALHKEPCLATITNGNLYLKDRRGLVVHKYNPTPRHAQYTIEKKQSCFISRVIEIKREYYVEPECTIVSENASFEKFKIVQIKYIPEPILVCYGKQGPCEFFSTLTNVKILTIPSSFTDFHRIRDLAVYSRPDNYLRIYIITSQGLESFQLTAALEQQEVKIVQEDEVIQHLIPGSQRFLDGIECLQCNGIDCIAIINCGYSTMKYQCLENYIYLFTHPITKNCQLIPVAIYRFVQDIIKWDSRFIIQGSGGVLLYRPTYHTFKFIDMQSLPLNLLKRQLPVEEPYSICTQIMEYLKCTSDLSVELPSEAILNEYKFTEFFDKQVSWNSIEIKQANTYESNIFGKKSQNVLLSYSSEVSAARPKQATLIRFISLSF
ncbi:hypothetical protein FGO68_gene17699 [Halteria grandinella]|uniref:Uncharacterized protein n=1 Tax=Halteria grandinella TaxID=5974 RepID=A0A8J8NRJ9_HALGN|nr:hypothetical protein FGO68_gene17699 [Halteria grandinella]